MHKNWESYFGNKLIYDFKSLLVTQHTNFESMVSEYTWLDKVPLVVKPDMLFGNRGKLGLVYFKKETPGDIFLKDAIEWIKQKSKQSISIKGTKGYLTHFLIEPFLKHSTKDESFVAFSMDEDADNIYMSAYGGIDIEEHWDKTTCCKIPIFASKEEITYCNMPITEIVEKKYTVTDIIGLLWFKQKFPVWASNFIDLIIKLTADHGPAVSGAHNTRVTARAGKDLTASIASGILTIGPRFGGAIDAAAKYFKMAYENKMEPEDFVEYMKNVEKIPIPGIGHRIKSTKNPDKRVGLLKNYVFNKFPSFKLISYALDVEKVTTSKKENLILNVDGAIGVSLVDMFWALNYKNKDIDNLIQRGAFNAFFVIGRTIGLIGHYLDEKRLNMPLYRHPVDDILYDEESPIEYSQEV
nr:citrate/2-methylcitrate synthase [Desulfurella multipotens]